MDKGYDPYNHNPFEKSEKESRSEYYANLEMAEAARRGIPYADWLETIDPHGELSDVIGYD